MGALQLGLDTPRVGESVVQEVEQHEAHQQGLETRLTAAATRLQTAVAQVRLITRPGDCPFSEQMAELTMMNYYFSISFL